MKKSCALTPAPFFGRSVTSKLTSFFVDQLILTIPDTALLTGYGTTGISPVFHWANVRPFLRFGAVKRHDSSRFVRPTAPTIQRAATSLASFGSGTRGPSFFTCCAGSFDTTTLDCFEV